MDGGWGTTSVTTTTAAQLSVTPAHSHSHTRSHVPDTGTVAPASTHTVATSARAVKKTQKTTRMGRESLCSPGWKESGTNWGRSRGQCLPICGVGEAGIPAVEVRGELVVEDAGADLEEQVGSTRSPAHLLFFHHAFADDLVDGGLDEGAGDGLPGAVAFPVVGDPVGVSTDVGVELTHRLGQSGLFEGGFLAAFVELALEVLDGLQGPEDVAVPEEPFEAVQVVADLGGEVASRGGRSASGSGGGARRPLTMVLITVRRIVM